MDRQGNQVTEQGRAGQRGSDHAAQDRPCRGSGEGAETGAGHQGRWLTVVIGNIGGGVRRTRNQSTGFCSSYSYATG